MRFVIALALATGCGFSPSTAIDAAVVKPIDAADAFIPDAVPADLVAWYRMEDTAMPILDATGHGHDGTCVVCPVQTDGVVGYGLAFTNARVDVPGGPELGTPAGTVAAWLALDATTDGYVCPFGKIFNQPANGDSWQLCLFQASFWQVFVTTSSSTPSFTAGAQITLGQWQHVAITWTTSKVELFVDGLSLGSIGTLPLVFDGSILAIGADRNFPDIIDSPITGKLDELKLFDRALTQPELAALAVH